jgi:hypothetical protein
VRPKITSEEQFSTNFIPVYGLSVGVFFHFSPAAVRRSLLVPSSNKQYSDAAKV